MAVLGAMAMAMAMVMVMVMVAMASIARHSCKKFDELDVVAWH